MKARKNLQDFMSLLKEKQEIKDCIEHWHTIEAKEAKAVSLPESLNTKLVSALKQRGINELYTHQASAFEAVRKKKSVVAVHQQHLEKPFATICRCFKHY